MADEKNNVADYIADIQKNGGADVGMAKDKMRELAERHGGEHGKAMLAAGDQIQALANGGNIDFSQLAAMAESMGVNDKAAGLLAHLGKETDPTKAASVPGLVVDKKTNTVKILGIDGFEVPAPYATMIAGGYTFALKFINGFLWDRGLELGKWSGNQMGWRPINQRRMGLGAAMTFMGLATHWPDVSQVIQDENFFRDEYKRLSRELNPVLKEMGVGDGRVMSFFKVTREQNELIYNERQRVNTVHNAQRLRAFIQAVGRATQLAVSAFEGGTRMNSLHDETVAATTSKAASSREAASELRKQRAEAMKEAKLAFDRDYPKETYSQNALDDLWKHEMQSVDRSLGLLGDAAKEAKPLGAFKGDILHGGAILATVMGGSIGSNVYNKRTKHLQQVSAFDMIKELKGQLNDDLKTERYRLPTGVSVEGDKSGDANALKLTEYIVNVFQQHEKDSDPDGKNQIGKRLEDRLYKMAKKISVAIRAGELDGMALVQLVGERKLVRRGGKAIASQEVIDNEIERLKERMRHVDQVDEAEYFNEATFTKSELKAAWNSMGNDEREVFASFIPHDILAASGVKLRDVEAAGERNMQKMHKDYHAAINALLDLGDDVLEKLEATKSDIKVLNDAADKMAEKGDSAIDKMLPGPGKKEGIDRPLANLMVRFVQHGGKVKELMGRGIAESGN